MKKEHILAIIPARGGSKSIPRKNLLLLGGKPLIAWPIDLAKSIDRIERVIVSSDDDEIISIAKQYGAQAPFKRPLKLAGDDTPTLAVLRHCVRFLEKKEDYKADIILLLYPTAPFLKKERVEQALDLFEKTHCNSVISVVNDWGRFWRRVGKRYIPFYPVKRVNRQYYTPLYRENGAVYVSRYEVVMNMRKIVDERSVQFLIMEEAEIIDIDSLSDFSKATRYLSQ